MKFDEHENGTVLGEKYHPPPDFKFPTKQLGKGNFKKTTNVCIAGLQSGIFCIMTSIKTHCFVIRVAKCISKNYCLQIC